MHKLKPIIIFSIICYLTQCHSTDWVSESPNSMKHSTEIGSADVENKRTTEVKEIKKDEIKVGRPINTRPTRKEYKGTKLFTREKNKKKVKMVKANKKKIPVRVSGSQFIREKKIHSFTKQEEVVLTVLGNTKVVRKKTILRAPKIEVVGEDGELIIAHKRVKIDDLEQKVTITAAYAEYLKNAQKAFIKGNPKIVFSEKNKKKTIIHSDEIERDFQKKETICWRNVTIKNDDFIGYGQKAIYKENEKVTILEGEPKIYQKDNIFIADKMILFHEKKESKLMGNVILILTERKDKDRKKKKEKSKKKQSKEQVITSIIRSDTALYEYGPLVYLGRKSTFFGTADKSVIIERPDSKSFCKKLEVWGNAPDEIRSTYAVRTHYYEEKVEAYSESLKATQITGQIKAVTSRATSGERIRPMIIFLSKQNKPTILLKADVIERSATGSNLQARGNVEILMLQSNNIKEHRFLPEEKWALNKLQYDVETTVKGRYAEFFLDDRKVVIKGRAHVERESVALYAKEIIIYSDNTKRKRMEMNHIFEGFFK